MSAKNAQRRNARQAHHIDARSAACGTLQHTLRQSTTTRDGACTEYVEPVMQSSNVLFAKQNERRNISAPQHGKLGNRNEEFACNAKPKLVALGRARPVNNGSPSSNFPFLSPRGPLGKTELRCATHAVPPLCRMLSASVLPRPPRRDWNLFAKEPATCRFYVTPGKRLQETEAAKNGKPVTPRQPPFHRQKRTPKNVKK